MSPIPKANALRLASAAADLGAEALRGVLERNQTGRWCIGHVEIEAWLARHADQEVILAVAAIEPGASGSPRRTCRTCGAEYEGPSCPHCEAVRSRLRGRP
jgi:rubrerythrin